MLVDRCTYVTACFIVKCRGSPGSAMTVALLEDVIEAVGKFVDRCTRLGIISTNFADDSGKIEEEIPSLHTRIDRLADALGLAGIATQEGNAENLRAMLDPIGENENARIGHGQ
ncbi:unnamed protein product, partial [Scytosiphon promiscuus]